MYTEKYFKMSAENLEEKNLFQFLALQYCFLRDIFYKSFPFGSEFFGESFSSAPSSLPVSISVSRSPIFFVKPLLRFSFQI